MIALARKLTEIHQEIEQCIDWSLWTRVVESGPQWSSRWSTMAIAWPPSEDHGNQTVILLIQS